MQFPPFGFGPAEAMKQLSQWLGNPALNHAIKEAAHKLGIKEVPSASNVQEILKQAGKWLEQATEPFLDNDSTACTRNLENGINATGDLFHPRWTSQPISDHASRLAAYLHSGYSQDPSIPKELERLLVAATGAADALVIANLPTAVQIVVQECPNIILPRIACLRLPVAGSASGVHLRHLIDAAGAQVTEIGSNSDCLHDDYAKATAMHPGSLIFQASPLGAQNDAYAAVENAKTTGGIVCTLALDASLVDLEWSDSKTDALTRLWDRGPDLIIAPTNYLLGGPHGAIILGKKNAIDRIRPIADQLGAYPDRITQALLHSVLNESLQTDGLSKSPVGGILSTSAANLENRAQRLAIQLQGLSALARIEVLQQTHRIGNGPWAALKLPTSIVRIYPQAMSVAKLDETLQANRPAIWTEAFSDHIDLVLRSVHPADDSNLVQALSTLKPDQ
jgi:seryl-tRNA(Sec) selenium transferase